MTEKMFGSNPARDNTIQDQEAELQRLQTEMTVVQAETAATVKDLIHTQTGNMLGESELAELQTQIATTRQELLMARLAHMLREMEAL